MLEGVELEVFLHPCEHPSEQMLGKSAVVYLASEVVEGQVAVHEAGLQMLPLLPHFLGRTGSEVA